MIQVQSQKEGIVIPAEFRLEEDLAAAYHVMEFTHDSLFLTGRAGTGKSSLLNYFRKNTIKKYVVLAPTGLAALQVGGNTIHSFFGFPLRPLVKNDPEIRPWGKGHPKLKIVRKMDTLIIDEVSMVRADILDGIDLSLRLNTGHDIPFGGKQVILIGDIFQLPPVVTSHDRTYAEDDPYYSPYFFSADAFRACKPRIIQLNRIYRQQDEDFIYLLNRIRSGIATADDLGELNGRYIPSSPDEDDFSITLASVNALADRVNLEKLLALTSGSFLYKGKTEGVFHDKLYPAPSVLQLKEGAQVMLVRNDIQGRWVNGSIGIIDHLSDQEVVVRFPGGARHRIDPVTWENKTYTWDRAANTINFAVQGTYTQYPIRLAWAITIHKSQGLTFDRVIVDIGRGAFAHGQLYVALSRCKTFEGLKLRARIRAEDIIVDELVERFASSCGMQ